MFMAALPLKSQEIGDQELRQTYTLAEEMYRIGRLEETIQLLQQNVKDFHGVMRQNAYRLIALSHLALDQEVDAERATILLLNESPYYTSVQDPPRFIDLINKLKAGRDATVTTASTYAEPLSEVPVPTTLITQDMIRNCGARNLQEVLAAYVPGMNIIDCNDDINIAMRGIYSNGQEKILFMLNGHRLNSYATNVAAPDFSISLEKLKQIEVLRGPASSLYGGVALTAVVNLITKDGLDVDGIQLKGGLGNYGQMRGDLLLGKRFYDIDILLWGSIYKASGEKRDVSDDVQNSKFKDQSSNINEVTIGGIGNKPSHDLGIQLNWGGLNLNYNSRFSQVVSPYTMSTLSMPYNYDAYMTFNGLSPGFAQQAHHADLTYSHQLGKLNIAAKGSYDSGDVTKYQVISDNDFPQLDLLFRLAHDGPFSHPGLFSYINLLEQTYGFKLNANYSYVNNNSHKGTLAFGMEYSHFRLNDARYFLGNDFNNEHVVLRDGPTVQEQFKGHENSNNFYIQLKHRWKSFIINAGIRYDHKQRADDYTLRELSPRLALIVLQPKWNLKLSYSKAFVDAPYLYQRANPFLIRKLFSTDYTDALEPESLHSLQLTFAGVEWIKGLNVELNAFYNHAKDMIVTELFFYENMNHNKTYGLELMASYQKKRFNAHFNLAYMNTTEANVMDTEIDANNNTPTLMSHLVLGWQPTSRLRLFSHLAFSSKQTSYNLDIGQVIAVYSYSHLASIAAQEGRIEEAQHYWQLSEEAQNNALHRGYMKATLLCDVGTEYRLGKLTLRLNVNNLFNTKYYRSGMNTKLVPQRGRWFMFNVGYNILVKNL